MKKKFLTFISAFALCAALLIVSFAHSGRTDSSGGHYDRSDGSYHYHHGYSAHNHYDMDGDGDLDCPYTFDDKTNHSASIVKKPETTKAETQWFYKKETSKTITNYDKESDDWFLWVELLIWGIVGAGLYKFAKRVIQKNNQK